MIRTPIDDNGTLLLSDALIEARAEMARRDFSYFVRLIRPQYDVQWFHDLIMERMQVAGERPDDARLGMAMPPGHGKTEYTLLFMAWMFVRDPTIQIKYISFSTDVAKAQFRRLIEILEDELAVGYFGILIRPKSGMASTKVRTATRVERIGGTGFIDVTGFGGAITASRCDLIVIDDPFKNDEEAHSLVKRNSRWRDYGSAIKTRRRAGRPLRIIMLFTRWHVDDLTGRCKRHEGDEWEWIELECIKDQIDHPRDPRKEGEALWPAVMTAEKAEVERLTRPDIFVSMYQQRPASQQGTIFLRSWFPTYEVLEAKGGTWYQSWDFRHGGKRGSGSYCVAILAFKPHGEERLYIVDVIRGRWDPAESHEEFRKRQRKSEQATTGVAACWLRASQILVEKKADGIGILSLNQGQVSGLIPIVPRVDKETRARAVAPFVRAGQVVLPVRGRWLADFLEEVLNFPGSRSDDQVDALSQLLDHIWLATSPDDTTTAAAQTWRAMMGA